MNGALRLGYEGVAQLARALTSVAPASDNKLIRTFAARRGALARFEAFARVREQPLLWMHAPSVGEGLQARPVLELLREQMPDAQVAYTYFSPSAAEFATRLPADFCDVLPFDAASDMRRAVRALAPTALVFSKVRGNQLRIGGAVAKHGRQSLPAHYGSGVLMAFVLQAGLQPERLGMAGVEA